ncbi:hypothetical protein [Curtobacterium sp. MCPF17_052]|uniref:hypothetical protein n=1 Tax=Curtobacterium sp. MCPF17_052 TaxID=2175655 RepID=UPI0024DF3FF8|nr:hypothetical protein [Curtobacterium sp. MCPF17_052]WIB12995.1 hypothetical protein DEJ36_03090 [Curtobacterium sp. MCPF17_052]
MLLSFPLAALGAWAAVRKVTTRTWVPVIGAVLYTVAPALVGAVTTGHLGAVIAHVLLPWLFLTLVEAHRSWASASGAALLFAVVAASAPSLLPVLLIGWLVALVVGWRHAHRRVFVPVPAAVLFVPLVLAQIARGNPLAVFADPGVPSATPAPSALQLAIGQPLPDWNGWLSAVAPLGLGDAVLPVAMAVLALPVAASAIGAVLGHRWSLAGTALVAALLGYATAFGATHLAVTGVGSTTTIVWPGSALSVFALAIVVAACIGIDTVPPGGPGRRARRLGLRGRRGGSRLRRLLPRPSGHPADLGPGAQRVRQRRGAGEPRRRHTRRPAADRRVARGRPRARPGLHARRPVDPRRDRPLAEPVRQSPGDPRRQPGEPQRLRPRAGAP